ncbi:hypothetical protein PVAND_000823 [Polypedilum vanderplanki]|uniref:Fas-binding factor 1 C-terminal domain-containing protein n=1 Tax=Polypedilum vanderplanki TaxID=319348 RepID=A0A9J6BLD0_POLVA|nr:hypothetical protein PVAND_000823 [Polypedilum vanderplanki]
MNLDLDDPLGDLLSDGSNDSLFGLEPAKKSMPKVEKKEEKQQSQPKANKKMEQLFGITEDKKEMPIKPTSSPKSVPKQQQPKLQPPPVATKTVHENFDTKSNDSLSSDLGFDPKKPKKKGNILDELLGISETIPATTKSSLPSKTPLPTQRASVSRQTTSETMSENVTTTENPPAARKSGRRQSAVMFNDPLGLFASSEQPKKSQQQKAAARKSIAGSEWLFADGQPTLDKQSTLTKLKSSPAIQITPNSEERNEEEPGSSNVTSLESKNTLTTLPSGKNQATAVMESLVSETANTINTMKQQEFQLMVASQMKTQENVLIEMKNKQQELLKQQENQFNELLRKQIARQSELEEIIKNQQERINSHIQALMASHTQVPFLDMTSTTAYTAVGENHLTTTTSATNPLEKIELEGDVKRLEMEKLRLEDLLSNINDNHEKEIIMIEQSYKKRIQLMEENLESMERRYRAEMTALEQFHSDKIKSINEERENVISNFEVKIKSMEESHQNFIDRLKQSYESDLEMLKQHYEEMMQNIRKSKFMEFAIKEECSAFADMMKRASSNLENATGDISQLHEVLQEKLAVLERDREIQLSSREKKLEEQQKLLERTRELSEAERQKLLDLVQTLELKLNSIEQKSEEEQWSLKQKLIAFEVERKSFEKEKEFLRSQISNEQQKLQELKQLQLNEHTKLLREIEEERTKLQEEKARNEIAKTLHSKNADEIGLSRAEIDAAVKYAEEAAKQSEKERERLIEMQRQCDAKRHEMMDRQNTLRVKQSELENSIIRAKQREKQAENFQKQTKKTELVLMAKYQSLQKYTMELSEREAKIAKERLDVNTEKLELQAQRKKLLDSRCSLCKIGEKANELKGIMQHHSQQQQDMNDDDDFDNITSANNERVNMENFGTFYKHDMSLMANISEDLENVPNLVDMNDEFLDSDLLMLKFDVLNSMKK